MALTDQVCEPYGHDVMLANGCCRRCGLSFVSSPERGAPRQGAGMATSPTPAESADVLREFGIAVRVGTLVPTGPAVRLEVDDLAKWLEPHEAHELAAALNQAATYAVHEDRASRRTRGVTS